MKLLLSTIAVLVLANAAYSLPINLLDQLKQLQQAQLQDEDYPMPGLFVDAQGDDYPQAQVQENGDDMDENDLGNAILQALYRQAQAQQGMNDADYPDQGEYAEEQKKKKKGFFHGVGKKLKKAGGKALNLGGKALNLAGKGYQTYNALTGGGGMAPAQTPQDALKDLLQQAQIESMLDSSDYTQEEKAAIQGILGSLWRAGKRGYNRLGDTIDTLFNGRSKDEDGGEQPELTAEQKAAIQSFWSNIDWGSVGKGALSGLNGVLNGGQQEAQQQALAKAAIQSFWSSINWGDVGKHALHGLNSAINGRQQQQAQMEGRVSDAILRSIG